MVCAFYVEIFLQFNYFYESVVIFDCDIVILTVYCYFTLFYVIIIYYTLHFKLLIFIFTI